MSKAHLNQQMTEKDLLAWMEDFLVRLELRLLHDYQIVHSDGTVEEKFLVKGAGQ